MALANYTELLAGVGTQLGRVDHTSRAIVGIALTEAKVNRALNDIRMETRYTATADDYMELPSGFVGLRDIQLNLSTGNKTLSLMSPAEMDRRYSGATGEPEAYCIVANQLQLAPAPDGMYTVEIVATVKVSALTSSSTTNWLLTDWPDIYLYGVTFEAAASFRDSEAAGAYKGLFDEKLRELIAYGRRRRASGPPVATRPA